MPVDAPLGDYSAIVNTPTGMRSVAMHVVEAAPTLHANANGIAGIYSPLTWFTMRSIHPEGLIILPEDGNAVIVTLFVSGLNPRATLEREVIFIRLADFVETRFPVSNVGAPGGPFTSEYLGFMLTPIPAGEYQMVLRVGTEFSDPENLTIRSNGPGFRPFRPPWIKLEGT